MTIPACVAVEGTISATANGVTNATSIEFPAWDTNIDGVMPYPDQGDIVWYPGNPVSIPQSAHPNGNINVQAWLSNPTYYRTWCGGIEVTAQGALPAPGNPSPTANLAAPANSVTLGWDRVSGAATYPIRIWDKTLDPVWDDNPCNDQGNVCDDSVSTNSYTINPAFPSHTYTWWVHAMPAACAVWGPSSGGSFLDPAIPPPPPATSSWWQVEGGGAVAGGNIVSNVPDTQELVSTTGDEAVVACGGTCSAAGSNGWDVASTVSSDVTGRNSYAEFKKRVGNKFTPQVFTLGKLTPGNAAKDEVIYWQASNDVVLVEQDLGTSRVVLLADGKVDITGNLTFGTGGFLAVLSGGDINVAAGVTNLMGVYLAQGTFNTGAGIQLQVDGSVAGLAGVNLQRTLESDTTPAEKFVYHPEYFTNFPTGLMRRKQVKEEEAP